MAEAIVEVVLEKLTSLAAAADVGLPLGFDLEIKRLASLLTVIKATLQDAVEKQFSDRAIKDWLGKLKAAAYILDDILDEYDYEFLRWEYEEVKCGALDKVRCSCLSSFHPNHVVFRYKIAKRMKRISDRLEVIAEESTKFNLTEMIPERRTGVTDLRQTTSIVAETRVYGREKDMFQIVDFLVGDASHCNDVSVYPIVGCGGIGKTTLAQLIFNHEKVVNHFELRLWVCVSDDFNLQQMTKVMIEAASGHAFEDMDLEPLQRRLQDLLRYKRYFLVLDDVWSEDVESWQRMRSVLACGANGTCILVTTRLLTVAAIMGTMPAHELSLLPDYDCWELFKRHAFGPHEVEQEELIVIGKKIVNKCQGLPIAAKVLGGVLRFKREKEEWLNVMERLSNNENSIMSALRLSYLHLPIKLRQCFAYCALFPRDEIISKQYLIELWMANGLISSNGRFDAEEVGEYEWDELYQRSFFQDIEIDRFGKVTSFKMHELVYDLAQSVAEDVCCIKDDYYVTDALSEKIHHLSDHRWQWNSSEEANLYRFKSLRTCILLSHHKTAQLLPHLLKCYSLRVLVCEPTELSSSIGHLKHLRYLNLSRGNFKTLPESLCKLWNLQILKLDDCQHLEKLPDKLICLKALQQLSLNGCFSLSSLPPHIGKLTSLRNLTMYLVGKEKGFLLAELGPLTLKGDLHINHLEKVKSVVDAREANMPSKKLNRLWLSWDRSEESELQENVEQILEVLQPDIQQLQSLSVVGYKGSHFPKWIFSPSLKKLKIEECHKFNVLEGVQWLICLEDLSVGKCIEVDFLHEALEHMTALYSLRLWDLPNLEFLPDCFGNLPSLHELSIDNCSRLRCLPTSLSLSNLKGLWIYNCPELEKRCEKGKGEDWPKIAHIPLVSVISTCP